LFSVTIDNKQVNNWLAKNEKELPKLVQKVVNQTSAFGLSTLRLDLPKRSGNLRNSYTVKKEDPLTHVILSKSKYADGMEFGYKSHVITPKAGHKFLMFANNDGAANKDGSVKAAAAKNLWKNIGVSKKGKLYSKVEGIDSVLSIFRWTGVSLARQTRIPAYAGAHTIQNTTLPKIDKYFMAKIIEGIRATL
jgi:hypothetical protein